MNDTSVVQHPRTEIQSGVDQFTVGLTNYLQSLDLPSDRVLVKVDERRKVILNLPDVVSLLSTESRRNAVYVSKFIAACGAGLFDAALNFLWDETIANLREKVSRFDLEYFFSSVVTDENRRSKLKISQDLEKLDDWELIRGCHLTGVLSDIGFKHLDYIRNMRNWASAAHPNQYELTGLQLISWLETCIREVISKEPVGAVIEVKRLLNNIRTTSLSSSDVEPIAANIDLLQEDLATSLLRTIFGMYTDKNMAAIAKNNIKLIASSVWNVAPDEIKYEMGLKYSTFAANAEIDRKNLAHDFLTLVSGLSYLPQDTLAIEVNEKINNLFLSHIGFNNFYNEPPHAKLLAAYIPDTGKIPDSVRKNYVKTLIMCRIGNGYGLSWAACEYYNSLIDRFQESEIKHVVYLIFDKDIISRLQFSDCADRYKEICQKLKDRTVNQKLKNAIDLIVNATETQLPNIGKTSEMKRILNISIK